VITSNQRGALASGDLTYGLHNSRLKHVSEVPRGLACDCICPACEQRLIARKGERVGHHFAHTGEVCSYGQETVLHLATKEILSTVRHITLPAVWAENTFPSDLGFNPSKWAQGLKRLKDVAVYEIQDVRLEHKLGGMIPDVLLYIKNKPLVLEVTVTHGIDERKLAEIKRLDISAIEIDLRDAPRNMTPNELRSIVIEESPRKRWKYNAYANRFAASARKSAHTRFARAERKVVIRRFDSKGRAEFHVDGCPIDKRTYMGESYADLHWDCFSCPHLVSHKVEQRKKDRADDPTISDELRRALLNARESHGAIWCDGHVRVGA